MTSSNSPGSVHDATIQALGFTGTDRYDLVRILRAGGPANTHDARLLEEYDRRDALSRKWYDEDQIANSKRIIVAGLVLTLGVAALIFVWPMFVSAFGGAS